MVQSGVGDGHRRVWVLRIPLLSLGFQVIDDRNTLERAMSSIDILYYMYVM